MCAVVGKECAVAPGARPEPLVLGGQVFDPALGELLPRDTWEIIAVNGGLRMD